MHHACAGGSLEILEWLVENMDDLYIDMLNQKSKVCINITVVMKITEMLCFTVPLHTLVDCM